MWKQGLLMDLAQLIILTNVLKKIHRFMVKDDLNKDPCSRMMAWITLSTWQEKGPEVDESVGSTNAVITAAIVIKHECNSTAVPHAGKKKERKCAYLITQKKCD